MPTHRTQTSRTFAALPLIAALAAILALTSCTKASNAAYGIIEYQTVVGATERGDFYSAANRLWLSCNRRIPDGFGFYDSFREIAASDDKRLTDILDGLAAKDPPEGSRDRKLSDYYRSAIDIEGRNAAGAKPVGKYLDAYEKASSLQELLDADLLTFQETGVSFLLVFEVFTNDNGMPILGHAGPRPVPLDVFRGGTNRKAYREYLETIFALSGSQPNDARERAGKVYAFEKDLSAYALSQDRFIDPANRISYPFYLFRTLYPNVKFREHFDRMGYTVPEYVIIQDQRLLEHAASLFAEKNVRTLSLYAQARLLAQAGRFLSSDFTLADDRLARKLFGITQGHDGTFNLKQDAVQLAKAMLSEAVSEAYVRECVPPGAKADVELMVKKVIASYRAQIGRASWMDDRTKERAIAKLDRIRAFVAYPDQWPKDMDNAKIESSEGEDFFASSAAIMKARNEAARARLGKASDSANEWVPAFIANAFYQPQRNTISIPAAMLQPPFYDAYASESKNLGGLGMAIAHEISHAFDSNGAKIDENGNTRNWWTKEDAERFGKRCELVRNFYDGAKAGPGVRVDGTLARSGNVADLMARQCMLSVLGECGNADRKRFFESFAAAFRANATPQMLHYLGRTDVHSLPRPRVNRCVSNFEEFQDTYGVKKGDPMYVAPEDRISLW